MNIKTVIMCHNTPVSTKKLYKQLSEVGHVDVFDSGSDKDKKPDCPCETFENLYWTGCWKEAMKRYGDSDFLWVLGGDVLLENETWTYYEIMEDAIKYNIGLWSPAVNGSCRGVMSKNTAKGKAWSVYHVEGIAMAASKRLMEEMGRDFPPGNKLGWGVDVWMSMVGWEKGMMNIIDGRVSIAHPFVRGYDSQRAWDEMSLYMENVLGKEWKTRVKMSVKDDFDLNIRKQSEG